MEDQRTGDEANEGGKSRDTRKTNVAIITGEERNRRRGWLPNPWRRISQLERLAAGTQTRSVVPGGIAHQPQLLETNLCTARHPSQPREGRHRDIGSGNSWALLTR